MKKRMRFYLPILFILWTGAFFQTIEKNKDLFIHTNHIIEIQNTIEEENEQLPMKIPMKKISKNEENFFLFEKEYKGKRSQTEMKEEVSFLLASYNGQLVREVVSDNFYCVYGFSDSISDYVISDSEKINLNFVVTYNEEKDITYVIVASPFYNEDF